MNAAVMRVSEVSGESAPGADAGVPSPLRRDLIVSHQLFGGQPFVIIKDPLSLKYFRLPAEEYSLASLFDGRRSLGQIRAEFARRYPHVALTQGEAEVTARINQFAGELFAGGFLETSAAGVRRQMELRDARGRKATPPWTLFLKALFLKLPVWDPDRLLIRMERKMRWIWTWGGFAVSLAVFLAGLVVFVLNFGRIAPSLNDFLSLPNLALVWALTIVVKIVHEFGHGLTCKHYGGEVHEMGLMVIVFSPFLYADVTDSYLFPKRRHRVLVAAAGIYIELVIAAIATLLWAVSQPGPTQQLLFNLMLITSVWTVLFNANPLMKFDGYYILTDLVGVPNLRSKAQISTADMFRRFLFGAKAPGQAPPNLLPRRGRAWFVGYSLVAQFYLLYVTLNIAGIFTHILKPYGLGWLGDGLGAMALFAMIVAPVGTFFGRQFALHAARKTPPRRPLVVLGVLTLVVAATMAAPWQIRVERPVVLQPAGGVFVRAEVPGRLVEMAVLTGQEVAAGGVIARLKNERIESERRTAELRLRSARAQADQALGANEPAAYQQARTEVETARAVLNEAARREAQLVMRSPISGTVLTPDLGRLASGSLRAGDALCEVAPVDKVLAFIPLTEQQARHIRAGQRVDVRVAALPNRTFITTLTQDTKTPPLRELPPNLVATLGGDLAAAPSADAPNTLTPVQTTFGIAVEVGNPDRALRPGMTGTARIHGPTLTLGQVLWMKLLDFISLDYRL